MIRKIVYLMVAVASIHFLIDAALPKLIVSEEVYGAYYWPKAPWLFAHVLTGLVAILIGWYQFIPKLRAAKPQLHRVLGRVYSIGIIVSAITGVYLAAYSGFNLVGKISLGIVPFIWLSTVLFGYYAIIKRQMAQHQEWMARSYVVTFFFIVFVILSKYLPYEYFGTYAETMPLISWFSWSIPLFVYELLLQSQKMKNTNRQMEY
ncbi:MAG: DUF2306 domain-containing protein [Bacteroidota bacterium]